MTTLSLLLDSVETSDEVHRHESEGMLEARTAAAKPSDMNSVPWLSTCELPPPSGDLKRKAESVRMPSESKRWMGGGGGLDLNLRADDDIAWRERRHSRTATRTSLSPTGRQADAICSAIWVAGDGVSRDAMSAWRSPSTASSAPRQTWCCVTCGQTVSRTLFLRCAITPSTSQTCVSELSDVASIFCR